MNSSLKASLLSRCSSDSKNSFSGKQGEGYLFLKVPLLYINSITFRKGARREYMLNPTAAQAACITDKMQPLREFKTSREPVSTP
eukprot:CAMPEP_0170505204 /NCGR_PEP_ID=MMETSP0208-20121228/50146_1 /TAXON_ID=197538 /ORGANISM="Strombidium inclinatum, Strain S3" /LENGTH=84 /DNA_ID=CAMNT_0010785901 /DNA_START=89 /DNA_END=339 /DNA_ORIENTATION=+